MSLDSLSSASPTALALVVLLLVFSALGFVDGVYIHLIREKLHTRPESRTEHLLHTGRAIVFVPTLYTVFADAQGTVLWIGIALLAVDEALGLADGAVERKSRSSVGGLTTGEYLIHVAVTGVHWAAIALALVLRFNERDGAFMRSFTMQMMVPGAIVIALVHVALALRKPRLLRSGLAT
jgi:hypothetical protein